MKTKIILTLILVPVLLLGQDLNLTLEESIKLGLKNSSELKISQFKLNKADVGISEVTSKMLPKLSLNGRYAYLSDVPPFSVSLPGVPNKIVLQKTIQNNYYLNASVEQPIFTGLKLLSLRNAAVKQKEAESFEYEKNKIDKIISIEQAFWSYYVSSQVADLINENLNVLRKHQKNISDFLDNGLVTKNDLLKINVEVSSAEMKLLEVENNKEIARAFFNKTVGLPLNSETKILVNEFNFSNEEISSEDLYNSAKQNRNELKILSSKKEALESIKSSARADYFPKVVAFGNYYYSNPNQRYMPLNDKFNNSWDVGIAFKWDVWNWGGTSSKVEKAEQDILQIEESLKLLRENIELDVYQNYLNIKKSKKKIELSKLQVESAEENYRITEKKYNQQIVTTTDLLDAEAALLGAKTNLEQAKVEYKLSVSMLNKSIGKISVENE